MGIDWEAPATPSRVAEISAALGARHPTLSVGSMGSSILDRPLWVLRFGAGGGVSLFVGALRGTEGSISMLLLRAVDEILSAAQSGAHLFGGFDPAHLLRHRTVYVVPMCNPDGVEIERLGAEAAGPLAGRLLAMNGHRNFSEWQANARGVDLACNFAAGFADTQKRARAAGIFGGGAEHFGGEAPESEPETAALSRLTRLLLPRVSLAFHARHIGIDMGDPAKAPSGTQMLASCFASVSGFPVAEPHESLGGYADFVRDSLGLPALAVGCRDENSPLSPSDSESCLAKIGAILLTAVAF